MLSSPRLRPRFRQSGSQVSAFSKTVSATKLQKGAKSCLWPPDPIAGRPDTQQAAQQPPQQPVQQGQAVRAPIRVGFPGQAPPNLTAPLVQAVNINANAQPAQPAQPAANPQSQPVQAVNVAPAPAPAPAPAANNGPPRTRLVYLTNNPGNPVPPGQAAFNERQRLAAQSQYEIFERQYPNFGRNDPWAYATDNL